MLAPAPPLTPATADRWNAARVPPWVYRAALPLAWFAAFTTFMFLTGPEGASCSPADPTLCGPDESFAFWIVIATATPLLLIMNRPVVGCLAGVAYAGADVGYDPTTGGQIAFVVHGALCLAVLVWVLSGYGDRLLLIWGSCTEAQVGPFSPPADRAYLDRLRKVMLARRDEALARPAPDYATPRRRPGPGWAVLVFYLVVVTGAAWFGFHP